MATPAKLGSVWIARATLYNSAGRKIGTCTDTPNAIAKAFMEHRSRKPVDSFIVALITHANAVWPMPKNPGPLYPQAR